jgi:hypothetical protein
VQSPDLLGALLLAQGDTFVIQGAGRVVWCKISVPRGLPPARGAAAGEAISTFLLEQVLERRSPWLGVVFDVRDGPSVIGPVSLRAMDRILDGAERSKRRMAILVRPSALVNEQLSSLARARAPRFAIVTDDPAAALDWMTASG